MSILTTCLGFLVKDVQSTIISVFVGMITLIIIYLIKFYFNVSKYPKGPFPLPILGNIRLFKGRMVYEVMKELADQYGPVYTIWLGRTPNVVLAKHSVISDAFLEKKNDFAGRPDFFFKEISLVSKGSSDVVFEDWGRAWEVLRRVAHTAARKFAMSPELPDLEVSIIDEVVDLILAKEGFNKPFDPKDYIYLMVYSILASIAAGKSYSVEDKEILALKEANDKQIELQTDLLVIEFLPFMRFVYKKQWKEMIDTCQVMHNWCRDQMDSHFANYDDRMNRNQAELNQNQSKSNQNETESNQNQSESNPSVEGNGVRDFCDALIGAKREAEENDSQAAPFLTSDNLQNVVQNLFQAGTETTRMTLDWLFLMLANFPEIQLRLRQEVESVIGSNVPNNDHRTKCHYVQAFISEVMRFSPIVFAGAPHKAIIDSEIVGHKVPKGTTVVGFLYSQLHDKEIWGDPEVFRPDRFLEPETGSFNGRINEANRPFSIGRRVCLGEKLALMNVFLQVTRFLQKTRGMNIVLKDGPGTVSLRPDPEKPTFFANYGYEIMIVRDE